MCKIVKQNVEWNSSNFEISIFLIYAKSTPQNFHKFLSLLLWITKRFLEKKKCGIAGLVFEIDAIDGKKWVMFVSMQQNSATSIYDLDTMKGTVKSYSRQYCSKPGKSHLVLLV